MTDSSSDLPCLHVPPCLLLPNGEGRKTPTQTTKRISEESVFIRQAAKSLTRLRLEWEQPPRSFLIVHKESESVALLPFITQLCDWLVCQPSTIKAKLKEVTIYLSHELQGCDTLETYTKNVRFIELQPGVLSSEDIDLIFTLGGDGTVLWAAWLFQQVVPPIVPFHFGSLGFLTAFDFESHDKVLLRIFTEGARASIRMRMNCRIIRTSLLEGGMPVIESHQALNEVVVDRGTSPYMSLVEVLGDGMHLTTVQADGLIVATPTGSTAYSLSAGGSMAHPDVPSFLLTPICPHTLNFRPLLLPDSMELSLSLSQSSRGTAWVSFDGRNRIEIRPGDQITITSSAFPVPTLCDIDQTADWFKSLGRCLHWNAKTLLR